MEQPTKKQKVEETTSCKEAVLFSSDTLSKIISYLPSVDVLNLTLTSKRFSLSNTNNNDDEPSLIEECVNILVQEIATEEQLAALPHYNGDNSLADYHYLQLMREPLTFDQLTGKAEYVNEEDKSCVMKLGSKLATAFSNNIMRAGKHYVTFEVSYIDLRSYYGTGLINISVLVGVMRPGQANQRASGYPLDTEFYQNFSRGMSYGGDEDENNVLCYLYNTNNGYCLTSDSHFGRNRPHWRWEGMESMSSGDEIGMLLI